MASCRKQNWVDSRGSNGSKNMSTNPVRENILGHYDTVHEGGKVAHVALSPLQRWGDKDG
jgi:hypothetical protein